MKKSDVLTKLLEIANQFPLRRRIDDRDILAPLTSNKIGLDYLQLYEYMTCVEEAFSVCFTIHEIRAGAFLSISSLSDTLCHKMFGT